MAQLKLTPMEFMRKYCKHEPGFSSPDAEIEIKVPANIVIAFRPKARVKAKVA